MASLDQSHIGEQPVVFFCGDVAGLDRQHPETASLSTLLHLLSSLSMFPWDFAPHQIHCEQVSFARGSVL